MPEWTVPLDLLAEFAAQFHRHTGKAHLADCELLKFQPDLSKFCLIRMKFFDYINSSSKFISERSDSS